MREEALFSRRALASALPIAALAGAPATTASAVPAPASVDDATLLNLGWRWNEAVEAVQSHDRAYASIVSKPARIEHETVADRLFEAEQALLLSIIVAPATTVRGLAVKAEAMARELDVQGCGIEAIEAAFRSAHEHETRIALSLALDILRLARPS